MNVKPIDPVSLACYRYSPVAAAIRAATHPVTQSLGSAAMFAGAGLRVQTPDVILDLSQQELVAEADARTRDASQTVAATAAAYRLPPFLRQYHPNDLSAK